MKNKKTVISLIFNLAVVVMECIAISYTAPKRGLGMLVYFTELSNILAGLACLVMSVCLIRALAKGIPVPEWARVFRYVGACALALTFFTVIFVLAPIDGGTPEIYLWYLTAQNMLYTHTLNPLVLMLTFLFLDEYKTENFKVTFLGFLPTVIYAVVAVVLNYMRVWEGPYYFLYVYKNGLAQSIMWIVIMLSFSYLLSFGLWRIKKAINKRPCRDN